MIVARLHPDGRLTDIRRHRGAVPPDHVRVEAMPAHEGTMIGVEVRPGVYRAEPRDALADRIASAARERGLTPLQYALAVLEHHRQRGSEAPVWTTGVLRDADLGGEV